MSWARLDIREFKSTLVLAFPIIFSQLGQMMMGVIDTIMIGHLGAVPLAAAALSTSLFALFMVFGFGFSSSISALVSHAYGAGEKAGCGEILKHGVILNLVASLIMAFMISAGVTFSGLLRQPSEIEEQLRMFLPIIGWSLVPLLVFAAMRQFLEGLSQTIVPMIILIIGIGINIFLNWVFIYGNLGFHEMGLRGAGYATFLARSSMMFLLILYLLSAVKFQSYFPKRWLSHFREATFKKILKQGMPSGFQYLFEVGAFSAAAVMMGWFGATALAAHQIAINLAGLTYMVTLGLSIATSIRIGQAMGSKQSLMQIQKIGWAGVHLAIAVMSVCAIVFVFGKHFLARIYISDLDVLALAERLIIVAAVFQIFDGIQGVAVGALRGMLDVKFPTLITFCTYWLFSIPLAYILAISLEMGPMGVWISLLLALALAAMFLSIRFALITQPKTIVK